MDILVRYASERFDFQPNFCGLGYFPEKHPLLALISWVKLEPRKKKPYYFPLYWLVNRDPYNGLL